MISQRLFRAETSADPLHDCELRYVHQIIIKTRLLLWKMHSGTNELPCRRRVLIIIEALSDAPCPSCLFPPCGMQEDLVQSVLPSFLHHVSSFGRRYLNI